MTEPNPPESRRAESTPDLQEIARNTLDWNDAFTEIQVAKSKSQIFLSGQTALSRRKQVLTCGLGPQWEAAMRRAFDSPDFSLTQISHLADCEPIISGESRRTFSSALIAIQIDPNTLVRVCQRTSRWLREHRLSHQRLIAIQNPTPDPTKDDSWRSRIALANAGFATCIDSFSAFGRFLRIAKRHFHDADRLSISMESIEEKVARNLPW